MPPVSSVRVRLPQTTPVLIQYTNQSSRRKAKDDDAAYIGASGAKRNRDSVDKTSVDGRRTKRKKVQQPSVPIPTSSARLPGARNQEVVEPTTMVCL
jgi:hypothetical protein